MAFYLIIAISSFIQVANNIILILLLHHLIRISLYGGITNYSWILINQIFCMPILMNLMKLPTISIGEVKSKRVHSSIACRWKMKSKTEKQMWSGCQLKDFKYLRFHHDILTLISFMFKVEDNNQLWAT